MTIGRTRPLIMAGPGDRDWPDIAEWIRGLLFVDREVMAVCYKPRDFKDWDGGDDWNRMNGGRPVRVRKYKRFGVVALDGACVSWRTVKAALGVQFDGKLNMEYPHPASMTDAQIAAYYGLDYLLNRVFWKRKQAEEEARREEAAIAKLVEIMGRRLTRAESRIARGLKPCDKCPVAQKGPDDERIPRDSGISQVIGADHRQAHAPPGNAWRS